MMNDLSTRYADIADQLRSAYDVPSAMQEVRKTGSSRNVRSSCSACAPSRALP